MSEVVRLFRCKGLLSSCAAVPSDDMMVTLGDPNSALERDIPKPRDQLHVPIHFDCKLGGYTQDDGQKRNELLGSWFGQKEILPLTNIQHHLEQLAHGPLGNNLETLRSYITQLLDEQCLASHVPHANELSARRTETV